MVQEPSPRPLQYDKSTIRRDPTDILQKPTETKDDEDNTIHRARQEGTKQTCPTTAGERDPYEQGPTSYDETTAQGRPSMMATTKKASRWSYVLQGQTVPTKG